MMAVPQTAVVMATAGVLPQTALTETRNLDSVPVVVSERTHTAECCHNGLLFCLHVAVMSSFV